MIEHSTNWQRTRVPALRRALHALLIMQMLLIVLIASPSASISVAAAAAAAIDCPAATPAAATAATGTAKSASPVAAIDATFPAGGGELTVFAAASLTDAFHEVKVDLEAKYPNLKITYQTAGSQELVTQLAEGARADVLATANTTTMKAAVDGGLISGPSLPFTGNHLVIVTPNDNPAGITSFDDLAKSGVKLVVAGPTVPAGKYAQQAICTYASANTAPAGFVDAIDGNVVSEENDVRSVLAKVQLGEADAGIVYASDAVAAGLAGTKLNVIEFPQGVPTRASYPIAVVKGGNEDLAKAFIAYVLSPDGQKVLTHYGFEAAQ